MHFQKFTRHCTCALAHKMMARVLKLSEHDPRLKILKIDVSLDRNYDFAHLHFYEQELFRRNN